MPESIRSVQRSRGRWRPLSFNGTIVAIVYDCSRHFADRLQQQQSGLDYRLCLAVRCVGNLLSCKLVSSSPSPFVYIGGAAVLIILACIGVGLLGSR